MPGERGPKGDHGQHGDEGQVGDTGEQGERGHTGLTGDVGERGVHGDTGQAGGEGPQGRRGPSNWQGYVAMGIAVALSLAVFGARLNDKPDKSQTDKIAAIAVANARTIQRVEQIRADTVREAKENHKALCTFRADLQRRAADGVKFLAEHPEGAFGFKPQDIRVSIQNQQRTIAALRILNC